MILSFRILGSDTMRSSEADLPVNSEAENAPSANNANTQTPSPPIYVPAHPSNCGPTPPSREEESDEEGSSAASDLFRFKVSVLGYVL